MAERHGITKRHLDLLEYVRQYIEDHGYSPSYEEIAAALGFHSKSRVYYIVKALVQRGYLIHTSCARSLAIPLRSQDSPRTYKLEAALSYLQKKHPTTFAEISQRFGV